MKKIIIALFFVLIAVAESFSVNIKCSISVEDKNDPPKLKPLHIVLGLDKDGMLTAIKWELKTNSGTPELTFKNGDNGSGAYWTANVLRSELYLNMDGLFSTVGENWAGRELRLTMTVDLPGNEYDGMSGYVVFTATGAMTLSNNNAGTTRNGIIFDGPPTGPSLSIAGVTLCKNATASSVTATVTDAPSGTLSIDWGPSAIVSDGSNPLKGNITNPALLADGEQEFEAELKVDGASLSPAVKAKYKVTAKKVPVVELSAAPTTVCAGTPIVFTSNVTTAGETGSYTYAWSGTGASGSTANITVNSPATGTYKVTVTDDGCSAEASKTVTVNPLPSGVSVTPSFVCNNVSTALNISGGSSGLTYAWSEFGGASLGTGSSVNVQFTTSKIVEVTATNSTTGCSATIQQAIEVKPVPTVTLSADKSSVCPGETVELTATAAGGTTYTYSWSGDGAVTATTPGKGTTTPNTPGSMTYKVKAKSDGCESAEASTTVTVKTPPALTNIKADPASITEGSASQLSVTVNPSDATIKWSGAQLATDNTATVSTGNMPTAGTYNYTVEATKDGCKATANVSLTVTAAGAALEVDPTGGPFCSNTLPQAINAGAKGGTGSYTYTWENIPAGLNLSATNVANPQVLATSTAGSYPVTVKVSDGNTTVTGNLTVVVNQTPTLTGIQASPASITEGNSSQLSVTVNPSDATILWSGGPLATTNTATVSTGNIASAGTYNYTVEATKGECKATANVSLTVTAAGAALVVNPTGGPFCSNTLPQAVNAGASGGTGSYTYTWENIPAGLNLSATNIANPQVLASSTAGSYPVTVKVSNGNTTVTGNLTVVVNQTPTLTGIQAVPSLIEVGNSSQLSVNVTPSDATIKWTGGPLAADNLASVSTGVISVANAYTYTVTATKNGCTATETVTLNVSQPSAGGTLQASVETPKCAEPGAKMAITLTASGGGAGATYSFKLLDKASNVVLDVTQETGPWTYNVDESNGQKDYRVQNFTVFNNGTSMPGNVLGLNANGEIEVKFKELPYVTVLEAPSSVINHCSGDMLTLTGAGASSYTWTNGVQNGVPFMPSAGQYTVTGTGANGCVKSSVVTVTLTPKPTILSISASSNNICQGESIIFNAQASAGANITWSDGITNGVPYTPMTTGYPVYTATATLATAPFCSVESSVSVTVDPRTEIYYKSKSPRNIAIGKNGSFSVKARGKGLTYQWYKKESGTWMQMSNSIASQPGIAGVNTDSLILLTVPQSWDQSEFRVVVTGTCGKDSADFILGVKECFDINLDLKMGIGIIPNTDPTSNVHGYFCAGSEISMIATLSSDEDYDIVNPSFTWFIDGEKFHTEHWEIEHSVAELKWIPDVSFEDDLLVKVCAYSDGACEEVCSRFFRIKARKPQPVTFELLASKGDKYCPGDTIDFWVSTNAAGNNPTYTWYNDVYKLPLEQSPSNKLLHYENERIKLVMGQEDTWVRVTMQPSIEVCPDSAIYDRKLFMTKSQIVEPSLRIINDINDTLACIGDQITFTAIYENAGENPKLEWRKDIWDLGYGISAEATLDKDKDMWIKCILTPGPDVCFTGTSLVDTMVIRVLDNPSVTIWSDMENKAEGDLITIQSEVTDMPTDPTYTWYVNKYMAQENGDTYNSNGFREGDVVQLAVNGARVCQTVVFSNELIINFGSSSRDTVITIYKGESVQNVAMAKSDAESQDYIFTIDRNDQAMWGTASITSSGLFNYKPNTDFTGSDHVKYTMINRYDKNKVMTGVVYINVLENSKYFVPNIITPNGDGINDTWRLDFISAYPGNVVTIYNRQGKVIFRSKDYQNDWGGLGSSSGSTAHTFLPNGIYTYIIDLGNKELLKGWVEIRRDIANKGF